MKWTICILLLVSFIVDVACQYLAKRSINTLWIVNVYTLVETLLLLFFFYSLFQKNKYLKRILSLLTALFLAFWIARNFIFGEIHKFDYSSQAIEFLILFFGCISFFFQKTKITNTILIYNTYEFWIVSALLIYCAATFFGFLTPMNATEKDNDFRVFEYIARVGSIIKNALIAIAFFINNKPASNNSRNLSSNYYLNDLKD